MRIQSRGGSDPTASGIRFVRALELYYGGLMGIRILLVEDDTAIGDFVTQGLREEGSPSNGPGGRTQLPILGRGRSVRLYKSLLLFRSGVGLVMEELAVRAENRQRAARLLGRAVDRPHIDVNLFVGWRADGHPRVQPPCLGPAGR